MNPFVHHGRHFGRTVHALCNVHALITQGVIRSGEFADEPDENLTPEYFHSFFYFVSSLIHTHRERREHRIFEHMLTTIPGLQDRLMDSSEEEIRLVADLVRVSSAHNTKLMCSLFRSRREPPGQGLMTPKV